MFCFKTKLIRPIKQHGLKKTGQCRPLFLYFHLFLNCNWLICTDIFEKLCQCWDSNNGSLMSEATALPAAPQPWPQFSNSIVNVIFLSSFLFLSVMAFKFQNTRCWVDQEAARSVKEPLDDRMRLTHRFYRLIGWWIQLSHPLLATRWIHFIDPFLVRPCTRLTWIFFGGSKIRTLDIWVQSRLN